MAPFFGPVKATVTGTPGTGSITPSTASAGYLAFSAIPSNVVLFCRADDGTAWETFYALWDGSALSNRVLVNSSTGSLVSLTSAAIVAHVPDPNRVAPSLGTGRWMVHFAQAASATLGNVGTTGPTVTGTPASATPTTTNYRTRQTRIKVTSAASIRSPAGYQSLPAYAMISATAFCGGFEYISRFGIETMFSDTVFFAGLLNNGTTPSYFNPSANNVDCAMFCKDPADTYMQFMSNDASGSCAKTSTGITLAADGFYETAIWAAPGERKLYWILTRLDTGQIAFGSTTTTGDIPTNDVLLYAHTCVANHTTATSCVMNYQSMYVRTSF